ncbi:cupin domain-containing protein [Denitrificimonas caeni]|uniref:cupin domain-containing protein n=1 Tax=Denitrificimonas caeni TaxID=521720 RepID=UPI001962CE3C|nr:cupin domain-containing protein [Denitrificimonas caeni]
MSQAISNIFEFLADDISNELFENIVTGQNIKIERIISKGHSSPTSGWYDQSENEWVIVLKGQAKIEFENQAPVHLLAGSYLNIPAHTKHKVAWTDPDIETIWLAVHYK